jgi:hypothetical protein
MGYLQYPTLYTVNCCSGNNKAAALSPGAAHDHRAATERSPESADEIGCAARRAPRRPLWMAAVNMNEVGDGSPSLACFPLVFVCAKKSGPALWPISKIESIDFCVISESESNVVPSGLSVNTQ